MSIFGDQSLRILRERWGSDVDVFAEELYALFQSDLPFKVKGPIEITMEDGDNRPAISITTSNDGPHITINNEEFNTDGDGGDDGGGDGGGGGGGGGGTATGVGIGRVTSGSGTSYTFALQGGGSATATVVGIDSDEILPTGTPAVIVNVNNTNYAYVSLWV